MKKLADISFFESLGNSQSFVACFNGATVDRHRFSEVLQKFYDVRAEAVRCYTAHSVNQWEWLRRFIKNYEEASSIFKELWDSYQSLYTIASNKEELRKAYEQMRRYKKSLDEIWERSWGSRYALKQMDKVDARLKAERAQNAGK